MRAALYARVSAERQAQTANQIANERATTSRHGQHGRRAEAATSVAAL